MTQDTQNLGLEGSCILKLPSTLDVNYAPHFYESVKDFMHLDSEVCIDASEVLRLTTPCVQVLLAFFEKLKSKGVNLKIKNPSESFSKSIIDLGLGQHEITTKYMIG